MSDGSAFAGTYGFLGGDATSGSPDLTAEYFTTSDNTVVVQNGPLPAAIFGPTITATQNGATITKVFSLQAR